MHTRTWFGALGFTLMLVACMPVATMTIQGPAQPAPTAARVQAAEPAAAALFWPERMALESGLSVESIRSRRRVTTGQSWLPMGAIMPLQAPVRFSRPASFGAVEAAKDGKEALDAIIAALRKTHGVTERLDILAEGNGAFLVEPVPARFKSDAPTTPRAGRSNLAFQFVTLKAVPLRPQEKKPSAELQRTAFFYYDPALGWLDDGTPIDPVAPKGLVVVLPGMFGTPGDQIADLVKSLRQRGYGVIRMMAHSSRFTETIRFAVPLDDGEAAHANMEAAGMAIGRELSDRAAECAYAVEAAVAYVRQERPALATLPLAAVGMSGGAMVLPTVAARDPKAWSALVFIGGGSDYLRIMATSNYSDWINAAKLVWVPTINAPVALTRATASKGGEASLVVSASRKLPDGGQDLTQAVALAIRTPATMSDGVARFILAGDDRDRAGTSKQLDALLACYRRCAPLDSANVAPLLGPKFAAVPSLMIVGAADRAVPAVTAEELWELLGKPERWSIAGGHEWLFLTLPSRLPKIVDWLDAKLVH